ncbi:hypothetical protein ASG40_15260 [Methylobacterium sp. Leaf399]|uniref:hypothetical protein n=1 Tax=unclassified Methylobacterium TaxID=2615210 RepID=UPI0006FDF893|nr:MULTISPECIES: hypothetical protein [unclassified Methylobacterium]KQP50329.1 hypothetical protein ASF39_13595 [Methylobacterium sp. Leaf108]KQT07330.1 hypothetical protein ASG40_15260 [Methylobacterium sp. Leaf399]KQT76829.1 hypothetical protein ASG59_12685 [Methylobacterium sp. Leaf466]
MQEPDGHDAFVPFADDATVRQIAAFSIENGTTAIALHGGLDITRDRHGLARARELKAILDAIVAHLSEQDLPEAVVEERPASRTVPNPFAGT